MRVVPISALAAVAGAVWGGPSLNQTFAAIIASACGFIALFATGGIRVRDVSRIWTSIVDAVRVGPGE